MESSKHNDELIKRKLDGVSIEPRKLKFAEVKANYDKAKEASSNKWGLYFIFGGIGIAVLLSTYFILNSNSEQTLALNQSSNTQVSQTTPSNNSITETNSSYDQNAIHSVGTTNEDKFVERKNSDATISETVKKDTNTITNAKEIYASRPSTDTYNTSNSNTKEANTQKKATSITLEQTKDGGSVAKNLISEEKKSVKKITSTKSVNNTSSINNELAARTKNSENKPIIKGKVRSVNSGNTIPIKKQQDQKVLDEEYATKNNNNTPKTQPLANSNVVNNTGGQTLPVDKVAKNSDTPLNDTKEENTTINIAKNETPKNYNGNTDKSSVTQQGSNDQNNNGNSNNANPEDKNESSTDQITKTDSISNNSAVANKVDSANSSSHIPGVIGTGSVSPRNKHKLLLGAEVSYSTLFYTSKENPNSSSQFSTGDPAFTTAYANATGNGKQSLFNGSAYLSYVYNEGVGVSAGVSYFNVETKVDLQPSRTPEYTTAIDYFIWNWVQDSSVFPPTLTLKIVDTAYKQVATGNYNTVKATVNGDSVGTSSYVNKVRYISIPFNLSYNFKIGAKFSVEPQAGVIYTMPLKSSHLVATDAYKFEYKKQKADLKSNLYFNAALKLGYNISNRTQLYIRQGYFFRDRSIYNSDQPITLSIRSIYTSFGINYRLK